MEENHAEVLSTGTQCVQGKEWHLYYPEFLTGYISNAMAKHIGHELL